MFSLLCLILCLGTAHAKPQSRIIFPSVDVSGNNCTLSSRVPGKCVPLKDCSKQSFSDLEPIQTCPNQDAGLMVCCRELRPAEKECVKPACKITEIPINYLIFGLSTEPKEFSYMAALGWATSNASVYDYKCGGAMVSWTMILTAAHCASVLGEAPVVALVGGVDLTDKVPKPVEIDNIYIHPDYEPKKGYHDIAMIKLKKTPRFPFSPACLNTNIGLRNVNGTAVGYGHTVFGGKPSNSLLKGYLATVPNNICKPFYSNIEALPNGLIETQFCAKDSQFNRDTCQGDSGSPFVIMKEGNCQQKIPYILGVTSFGLGCATDVPGVYMDVSKYLDWIEPIVWPKYFI